LFSDRYEPLGFVENWIGWTYMNRGFNLFVAFRRTVGAVHWTIVYCRLAREPRHIPHSAIRALAG
jgi:hypothetical protein